MSRILFLATAIIISGLVHVEADTAQTPAPAPAQTPNLDVPFSLPATFQGTTACADCPGIRVTITLNADGTYNLEREYEERPARSNETGHWMYDRNKSLLTLYPSGSGSPQLFAMNVNPTLQAVDAQGKVIAAGANFTYTPWLTFADLPVPLENTPWRLSELAGNPITPSDLPHTPTLTFDAAEKRVSGSGGCNQITGPYEIDGSKLHFGPIASTRMACPQPVMDMESAFLRQLAAVDGYKIENGTLSLYGADGSVLAKLSPTK